MGVRIEEDKGDKEYSDDYDIIKALTDVHSDQKEISKDFVLFNSKDEQLRTFITEQFKIARRLRAFIKHEATAKEVYKNLMSEIILIAVLNRNDEENFILRKLLQRGQEMPAEQQRDEDRRGLIDRILRREKTVEEEE